MRLACLNGSARDKRKPSKRGADRKGCEAEPVGEIVAPADTNNIVIGTVKRRIGPKKGMSAYQKLILVSEMFCLDFGHSNSAVYDVYRSFERYQSSEYVNLNQTIGKRLYLP